MFPGCSHSPAAPQLTPGTLASLEQFLSDAWSAWLLMWCCHTYSAQPLFRHCKCPSGFLWTEVSGLGSTLPGVSCAVWRFQIVLSCREGTQPARARRVSEVCTGKGFSDLISRVQLQQRELQEPLRRQGCNISPRGLFVVAECHHFAKQKPLKNQGFGFGDWLVNICIHLSS